MSEATSYTKSALNNTTGKYGDRPVRLGISSCLLGHKVRFDGGHKLDPWIVNTLGQFCEFVPVCPEVESGLPIPRETLRLVGDPAKPRMKFTKSYDDYTDTMETFSEQRVKALEPEKLCGFIFKRASPSSGMERVNVYKDINPAENKNTGAPSKTGVGIFARIFMEHFPLLPVEEEGRLHDPVLRENFIERIFTMQRWRDLLDEGLTPGKLVAFHTRHKLQVMAHSVEHYRMMGKLVAKASDFSPQEITTRYQDMLLTALERRATAKKHANVLSHIQGYFKNVLSSDEKQELVEVIDRYRLGMVPLIVPVTLCNHYVRKYGEEYLASQWYLNPHPVELKLRNHV